VDPPSPDALVDRYGYAGVAAGAFFDSFGLPSSGEIVLLLAGAGAALRASLSLPLVIAVAWAFAVAGDLAAYALGRAAGPRLLARFGVGPTSRLHRYMDRHGGATVAAARLLAGARTKVAVVSGSTGMPLARYAAWDAAGALVWATAVGCAGYLGAESVTALTAHAQRLTGWLAWAALAAVLLAAAVYLVRRRSLRGGRL
jgi:undecaprenyl-diphosphatase